MKIKALKEYYDSYEMKDISLGQIYDTTQARGEYIVSKGYAEVVVESKENKNEPKTRRKNAVSKADDSSDKGSGLQSKEETESEG